MTWRAWRIARLDALEAEGRATAGTRGFSEVYCGEGTHDRFTMRVLNRPCWRCGACV